MDDSIDPRSKPLCTREDALAVLRALRDARHVAYFAGGCVRDLLLGMEPKDYDVATDAAPPIVRSLFRNTQAVGQAFGVILVRLGQSVVEVATFRSDGAYLDGRRPSEVRFTTAEEDAKRRDFTINGLFLDPFENRVIDFVGGQDDLKNKLLRAIGDPEARFEEDHLRLMRAVRFAARFGLEIEPKTRAAIVRDAPRLTRISPERVGEEVRLMLTPPTRTRAWEILNALSLAPILFRFLKAPLLSDRRGLFELFAQGRPIPLGGALAAATLDIIGWPFLPEPDRRRLLERSNVQRFVQALRQSLKISNDESDAMQGALEGLGPLLAESPPTVAMKKRFLACKTAALSRDLFDAIAGAGVWEPRITELQGALTELAKLDFAPAPLVTGDDLTAAGLKPGPVFKRVLELVYDAQLEDRVKSKDEALGLGLQLAGG